MPTIKVSDHTLQLIRGQAREGYIFACTATCSADGLWDVPVDDEVAMKIATERLTNATDDDVVVAAGADCNRHAARLTDTSRALGKAGDSKIGAPKRLQPRESTITIDSLADAIAF